MSEGENSKRVARRARVALATTACTAAAFLGACTTIDPYEITCRELNTTPSKLRSTALALAGNDVQTKVRYQQELEQICADAPEDFRPGQRVKPEE